MARRAEYAADRPGCELRVIQEPGGVSASKLAIFDRPGGKELCDLITAGRVEAIYVDAQDRLCRDEAEWPVFRALCDASDTWIVVNMRPIPRDLGGKALSYFTALVAQQESKRRSTASVARRAPGREGLVNGGRRRFGFQPVKDGKLTPRPAEVEVVRSIFEMAREGKTQSGIARELNAAGYRRAEGTAWTQSTVQPSCMTASGSASSSTREGTFQIMEPLIPVELFEAVQRGLHPKGPAIGRRRSQRFLLSNGLLRCGSCGHAMGVWRDDRGRRLERYRCTGRLSGAAECKQSHVPREPIDRAVLEYFTQVALDVEGTLAQLTGERDRRLADLDTKLEHARSVQADAERQLERLDGLLRDEG